MGKQRPLTAAEITHLYLKIQTSHLESALVTGFDCVVSCENLKKYMRREKEIAKKHVDVFSSYLHDNDLPFPNTWDTLVQPIKESPFSEKLISCPIIHLPIQHKNKI